jgi:UDP-N-acetylmuramyl pentapeptide phosphotransferase/UDP-N-acetylglucosamine-1-phosphate transferase
MVTALALVFLVGPFAINQLRLRRGVRQPIHRDSLIILSLLLIGVPLWGKLTIPAVLVVMAMNLGFGLTGLAALRDTVAWRSCQTHEVGTGALAVVCGVAAGAGLGFVLSAATPASAITGDIGSLAVSAMIGTVAVATTQGIVFAPPSGLFPPPAPARG